MKELKELLAEKLQQRSKLCFEIQCLTDSIKMLEDRQKQKQNKN